ncbi:MAG: response regulator transcription factor [Christensenella sp.]|nr:response regulator transcription factor [Christensenella sp.]
MRLLLVEDDGDLYFALKKRLSQEGFDCDVCENGADAEYYLKNGGYSAVILDRLLPEKDGLTILREMRTRNDLTPVLMLTALDTVKDRTDGLDTGADDYLVKPFAMPELLSRIRALVRRPPTYREEAALRFGDLALDVRSSKLSCGKSEQTLSRKELAVFELFFDHPERVMSRAEILSRGWGGDEAVEDGNVDNYIYFLRRRLKAAGSKTILKTIHGVGYQLVCGE